MKQYRQHTCLLTHPACQQNLRGCRPTLDHRPRMFFLFCSMLHLACGILLIATSLSIKEYRVRYDDKCFPSESQSKLGQNVTVKFDNPELTGNVYLYYELDGFYQSHFRFTSSFSADQMQGRYVDSSDDCEPVSLSYFTSDEKSRKEGPLSRFQNTTKLPAPCGLFTTYFFTDFYYPSQTGFSDENIIWKHEMNNLFKKPSNKYSDEQRWMKSSSVVSLIQTKIDYNESNIDPSTFDDLRFSDFFPGETQNEHFIIWMRTSHHPYFKKLFMKFNSTKNGEEGKETKIKENLEVTVSCNYDNHIFRGKRYLVLTKPNQILGGNNMVLAIINFGTFALLFIFSIIFIFIKDATISEKTQIRDMSDASLGPSEIIDNANL